MAASIYPEYPPDLTAEQKDHLLFNLNDWAIANGLAVRPSPTFVSSDSDPSGVLAVTAPVTLFPSLFPKSCFQEARAIQKAYNGLYAAIASDQEWLGQVIQEYGRYLFSILCSVQSHVSFLHLSLFYFCTALRIIYITCSYLVIYTATVLNVIEN